MNAQVVPFVSMSNATDPQFWVEQGWKGALLTVILLVVGLTVWKGKLGFVSIGPSEAGIRELCGKVLWRVGPGLHPDAEGIWKVRKTSVARIKIRLDDEYGHGNLTWQYGVTVWLKVADTKAALIAQIYTAQDLNRENMENSEAVEQATDLLMGNLRELLEEGVTSTNLMKHLKKASKKELLVDYGYLVVKTRIRRLVKRPQSELAEAIANGKLSSGTYGAFIESSVRPDFEVITGGSAQMVDVQ